MVDFIKKLFSSDFMGHGYCYLWRPEIIWLHVISDCVITLSYYFIPLALVYLVRRRKDLPFHWMFFMFGIFIVSCGTTHAMEIWTLWHGTYRLAGVIKAITAASSLATACALVPMVPKALLLPSPAQLRAANRELEIQIAERVRIENTLKEQRNFIAAVLNTVGTLIIVLDLKGRVVRCNEACQLVFDCRPEAATERHITELIPSHQDQFQSSFEQAQQRQTPTQFEAHLPTRGGGDVIISWSFTVLADTDGATRHLVATGVNVTESRGLETTILDISAREQARIGRDLHDGLGQHLAGIAFLSKALERDLADRSRPEAQEVARIVQGVNDAISRTRELAHGLQPVSAEAGGLTAALERLAREMRELFGIGCCFACHERITVRDDVATHFYRIAQEAVANAIKHGHARHIEIALARTIDGIGLNITDDGDGLPADSRQTGGMGLRIMDYRANVMGGSLEVRSGDHRGTTVSCNVPNAPAKSVQG